MSDIDLRNPQVLRNWLTSRMKEGHGTFQRRDQVLVFKDNLGGEYVVPDGVAQDLENSKVVEAVAKPVVEAPTEEATPEVKAKAKAKAKAKVEAPTEEETPEVPADPESEQ